MSEQHQNSEFVGNSIQLGVEHWEDEISFLEDRLGGMHGDIDDEDREACVDALEIAKTNLEDAKKHLN